MKIIETEVMNGQFVEVVPDSQLIAPLSTDAFPPPELEQRAGWAVLDPAVQSEVATGAARKFDGYAAVRAVANESMVAARIQRNEDSKSPTSLEVARSDGAAARLDFLAYFAGHITR